MRHKKAQCASDVIISSASLRRLTFIEAILSLAVTVQDWPFSAGSGHVEGQDAVSESLVAPLRVMQANTWQQITFAGSKPSARDRHAAAWSDAADGLYIHGGSLLIGWGLRRSGGSGGSGTSGSEAVRTSCGNSVVRLALGMEREHGVP